MAKEPDQNKWVGIRPTDPSENIPVTESSPISEIDVNPAAGCGNFPVTESAPLTDILVAPSAGNPEFLTSTEKRAPAISDLQAISALIRVQELKNNVGAPNYNHDIYEVPADKIFTLNFIMAYAWQADPTHVTFMLLDGADEYPWYYTAYGAAFTHIRSVSPIIYDEGEIVRIHWSGTLVGTDVHGMLFGHLVTKY